MAQAEQLRRDGATYKDISVLLSDEENVVTSESIRWHIGRKRSMGVCQSKIDGLEKVLVLTDLHCPFNLHSEVLEIVRRYRDEISAIIFGGDIIDCESCSSFPVEGRMSLIDEMQATYDFLHVIDLLTPDMPKYLIFGNHEARFKRYLANTESELNTLHSNNILQEIVGGFEVYDRRSGEVTINNPALENYTVIDDWFMQYNDLIVCHPISFSQIPLRTATNAVSYFSNNGYAFNALACAHTHKQGQTFFMNKWCCETGCLCEEFDYQRSGKLCFTPQRCGFLVAAFFNKQFDPNQSKVEVIQKGDHVGTV